MASSNSPCAACKFLRRKCTQGCVFAPYFPPDQPQKFANVHRVFGASNVAKLLNDLSAAHREDAVNSLAYEAEARLRDPVYGCVGYISILQQRLKQVHQDLIVAKKELATYIGPAALGPILQPHPSAFAFHHQPPPQQQHHLASSFGVPGMGLGLATATPQMMQQQQQQMAAAEAQQLAAVVAAAAREQELMRNYEQQQQQQQEMARFNSGFDGRGFNQMGGGNNGNNGGNVGATSPPPSGLALVSQTAFENPFQIQQQQIQQLQLQFSEQQRQHHQRAGSDEGRSGGGGGDHPSSS